MTDNQKDRAWELLNLGGDNRDDVIAEKIGASHNEVCTYLAMRSKLILERINNRIDHEEKQLQGS